MLLRAYANRSRVAGQITDDAQLAEHVGQECHVVAGSPFNIKITTALDLLIAEAIVKDRGSGVGGRV